MELGHVTPHSGLSPGEVKEFLQATENISKQHSKFNVERLKNKHKHKKVYKRWNETEKYTVMLAIASSGSKDINLLRRLVEGRSENQVRDTLPLIIFASSHL